MTSLSALVSNLTTEIRMDKFNKVFPQAEKENYINQAYLQVQKDGNYMWRENQAIPDSITVSSGVQEYDLPTDFVRLELVMFNNNHIFPVDYYYLQSINPSQSTSQPSEYYIYGNKIGLYPIPTSGILKLFYRKKLPTLTDVQDTLFPSDFDSAIVKYAAYLLWSSPRGNEQVSEKRLTDYDRVLSTLKITYLIQDSADLSFSIQRRYKPYRSPRALYYD